MIASVLKLNRVDCKRLELKDEYGLHKIVYSLFSKQEDETRDFLFADKGVAGYTRQILILSQRKPAPLDFGELISKEIPESFLQYDNYGFEVTLNPTTRNGQSRKIIPVRGKENLGAWFIQKAPTAGFEVEPDSLDVRHTNVKCFDKIKEGEVFSHTHNSATFIGKLKVTDIQLFKKSFEKGMGRAKGFGFGLLQIVPIQK